jgi:hypothetical protein
MHVGISVVDEFASFTRELVIGRQGRFAADSFRGDIISIAKLGF